MQTIWYLFDISFLLGLVDFCLDLLYFCEYFPLIVFGIVDVAFQSLDFFDLLLEDFLESPQIVLIRLQNFKGMASELGWIANAILQKHQLFINELHLCPDFYDLSIHEHINIFESCDLFMLLSLFGLCFYL